MKYFTDLADESPLPVVLYNVPGRAGVDMVPETVIQVRTNTGESERERERERECVCVCEIPFLPFLMMIE